jgi:transposase
LAKQSVSTQSPDTIEMLRALLAGIDPGKREEILALFKKLVARNRDLERRLGESLSRVRTREGFSAAQLALFLDAMAGLDREEAVESAEDALRAASRLEEKQKAATADALHRKRQPRLRQAIPAHLPRVRNEIRVPEEKRACPSCGDPRESIGHDVSEVIDVKPAELFVRQDAREKLACRACEGELTRAPLGDKVVSGGRFGSSLVAEILVDKYDAGLPLHRQKLRYSRLGLDLSVSTLADQVAWAAELLRPLWRASMKEVLDAIVMHLDGTGLPVRDRDAPDGIKLGTLWGYVGGETALYLYASTGKKSGQKPGEVGPEDFLARREGYTVADASSLFDASFKRAGIIECGCNMHARRYFVKALDRGDKRAALPLAAFKELYDIEEEHRGKDPPSRLQARQTRSRNVYEKLLAWVRALEPHEPPSSPMGAAIRYLSNHQAALTRFLDDPEIPLDNGVVERLHVRTALTRKNYLFAGSDTGAERAAIAYTVLGSCRLANVNPVEYLRDVMPRLAVKRRMRDNAALLPTRWKVTRSLAA